MSDFSMRFSMRSFCLVFGLFFLLGCHSSHKKVDLVTINGVEPDSLDPAIVIGEPDQRVVNELFEGLLRFDRDGQVVAGVASSWDISSDRKTYTFHLRPEAQWSDGTPVTAQDFLYSWKRCLIPETACAYNYQFFIIKGAEDFANGVIHDFSKVGIKALDNSTLQVELIAPLPYFLDLCAFSVFFPVSQTVIERFGDNWIKPEHFIGNGPYLLETWRINDKITLRKNPRYWDAKNVSLNRVNLLPITQATVAYNFYASGQAQLLLDKMLVPPSLMKDVMKLPDFHSAPFLADYFLRFNCSKPPFSDPRVRKAFALCMRPDQITKKIARGGEIPARSLIPPGIPGYQSAHDLEFNPKKARQLLAEAGYPGGVGFPLTKYLYNEGELNEGVAVELQATWKQELGVEVVLSRQEWKVYLNSLNCLDYGIARSSWIGDYPDPNTFLDLFVSGGGNNRTGWSNHAYDQLIRSAATEVDPQKRFDIFRHAEHLLLCDGVPIVPIFFFVGVQIYDSQVLGGIHGNILDKHPIWQIYRKKS